jgi:hypothetical protein
MSLLASLALMTCMVPQGPQGSSQDTAAAKAPMLAPAEHEALRGKLIQYLVTDAAYAEAKGKDRDKASTRREKAKEDFDEEWDKAKKKTEKQGDLLGSMADMRAIFSNCFQLKPPAKSLGNLFAERNKDEQVDYSFFLPKTYKPTTPTRTIWVVPGTATADNLSTWTKASDYFAATWDKSATSGDSIFHFPHPPTGLELDPIPDFTREAGEAEEQRRIALMWSTFAETLGTYNVERNRLFLDCGRGASGFGVRFMTMFPDRFAGAILRAPVEVDDLRLGSLTGVPFLLLRTAATATAVDALKKRLEEVSPGLITVLEAKGDVPHKESTPEIEEWLKDKKRNAMPTRVVIEPNHDKFNRAYWADIDVADPLATAAPDKKPRLECVADRAANRITVKAVGVERFTLFLNDDLVDLSKEFTVVVNDKAVTEQRTRSLRDLRERVISRSDWEFLFPVAFTTAVPK